MGFSESNVPIGADRIRAITAPNKATENVEIDALSNELQSTATGFEMNLLSKT